MTTAVARSLTLGWSAAENAEAVQAARTWRVLGEEAFFHEAPLWWDELLRRAEVRGPFMQFDWLKLWWTVFGHDRKWCVLVDGSTPQPRWALPLHLGVERMAGVPVTTFRLPTNVHSGPADVILSEPDLANEAGRAVLNALNVFSGWDLAVLEYLPETSPVLKWVDGLPVFVRKTLRSPYVELQGDFDALLRTRSRHFRQLLRRKMRKALNTPGFEIHRATEPAHGLAFWNALEKVEASSWKAKAGTAILLSDQQREFYRGLVDLALERGWSYLTWATYEGAPVAYELAVRFGDTVHSMKIAYDQEYAWLSPGVVLKAWVMQKACEEGAREQDLMGHSEPWKLSYTDKARQHVTLYVFNPRSWRARMLYRLLFAPRTWARRSGALNKFLDWRPVRQGLRKARLV
ncbi:MAG: GNAT family N-acetyltransferase [Calditrichaeota bacterium]|nr:GNAT family N-acetyltransferase [Calditrichota bacterium]